MKHLCKYNSPSEYRTEHNSRVENVASFLFLTLVTAELFLMKQITNISSNRIWNILCKSITIDLANKQ